MVNFSSSGALHPGRHPVWFILALYLILGLGLAASADAEHLSQRHSHARKSLDHTNSNAKRAPVPQLKPVRQVSGSLLDIGANGVSVVIGGEDGLINVTLPPGSTSAPAETGTTSRPESTSTADTATAAESTSTSDATTSLSDESISVSTARTSPIASSPSTSDATSSVSDSTSIPTTTSPPTTTAPASTSPVASLPATPSTPTTTLSTETTSEGSTTTSCAAGLSIFGVGVEAACVPITTSTPISTSSQPPATTTEATTNAPPASSASDWGSSRSDGLSTFTSESSPAPTSEVITGAPPAPTTSDSGDNSSDGLSTIASDSSPLPSTSEACNGVLSLDLLGGTVCVPSILPTSSEQPEPSSDPVTSFDPSDSTTQSSPDPAPSSDSGSSADPSTTCTGLLCGILPGPTSDSSSGEESAPSTTSGQEPTDTDSSSAPPETSVPGVSESESTTCTGFLCEILPSITSSVDTAAPSESEPTITTSEAVTTSDANPSVTTTSESCSGSLCSITSLLPPITITTSTPGENSTDSITSLLPPITTTTSSPGENSTDSVSPPISTPPPDTSELPPVENSTTTITSDFNTTTTLPPITTTTTTPGENSTVTSDNATSTDTSSIAFPTGNTTTSDLVTLTSTFSPPPTSVASEFSFLTQSSLLFSEITSSASPSLTTLTNPDEATTSATLESAVTGATVSSVPLPSGLPAIIYPAEGGVSSDTILTGYTHVSILFDASLGWPFVANNTDSAAQIFAYFPVCLQVALGISLDQVRTFALQAYKTSQYRSPEDLSELRTLYISYIPDSNVTALEQAIKAKQSNLYTRTTGISNQLAQRIDVSYSVTSAPDPISEDPGSPNGVNPPATSSNTRRDAIIGVCSALGGIAVCILGFLLYRNFKRRQEAAHHRLAEPQTLIGPTPGQDFDRDSIGGQRRRSFYYAEDSLRGFAQPGPREEAYTHNISPAAAGGGMRERRTIAPGTISAPILRDNTLNW